jgi:hypothetical protein
VSNPWSELEVPRTAAEFSARRIDEDLTWDFFWARSVQDRHLLLLLHRSTDAVPIALPRLSGIRVRNVPGANGEADALVWALVDEEQRELFHTLCLDIKAATAVGVSEPDAVARAIARTYRWHHMLRGGRDERLSAEEQKGLIGELVVLRDELLEQLSATDALTAWTGPEGSPKDFTIGPISIEAKARRGTGNHWVSISSSAQLDDEAGPVFMSVLALDRAPAEADDGETVAALAAEIRTLLVNEPSALERFETLLEAAGLRREHDYTDYRWAVGERATYMVREGFPRLASGGAPAGVSHVTYRISLDAAEGYRVESDQIAETLKAEGYVD